jgi:AmpD protein
MSTALSIDISTGLLLAARQVLSPHWDARPPGVQPDLIVVHGISLPADVFGGPWIDQLFCGNLRADAQPGFDSISGLRVSAHVVIRRSGEPSQYVPFHQRAWHAGRSRYREREACNDFSIGIELEGSDRIAYEAAQYTTLAQLIIALCESYPTLSRERIVGHSDIAPGRKTDPGPAFDWQRLGALLI